MFLFNYCAQQEHKLIVKMLVILKNPAIQILNIDNI